MIVGLRNAGRRVGGRWLFRSLSFDIRGGDMICLTGANGSGKSVLLRALSALDPLNEGDVWYQGRAVTDASIPRMRRQVLYVAQRGCLLGATLRESLRMAESFKAARPPMSDEALGEGRQERAGGSSSDTTGGLHAGGDLNEILQTVGRDDAFLDLPAEHLSGGELLVATLVQAMVVSPHVLLLDEPTAALDDASTKRVEEVVRQWQRETANRAVLWVTHDSDLPQRLDADLWRLEDEQLKCESRNSSRQPPHSKDPSQQSKET